MKSGNQKKVEPWRIVVFILGVLLIVAMWAQKDIAGAYAALPKEQMVPMVATTAAVSLVKVAVIAGGILLFRWIAGKVLKK